MGFLLLAVPWPSGLEQDIVQSLMRGAASIAAEIMNLLAIPAEAQGNLIRVRGQLVGVDEACSGIRSLQTTLMGGCLLGELSRFSVPRRLALLGGGVVVALTANVFPQHPAGLDRRDSYDVATLEKYHDLAGVSVLLMVFAGLLWINARARARPPTARRLPRRTPRRPLTTTPPRLVPNAGCWWRRSAGWRAWRSATWRGITRARPVERPGVPRWTVVPPTGRAPATRMSASTTARRESCATTAAFPPVGGTAGTGGLAAAPDDCSMFFFRWEPGHASAAQAEMHQPHICLTASGLTQTADWGVGARMNLPGRPFAARAPLSSSSGTGNPIYVFFVVWQDGVGRQDLSDTPTGRWDRLRAVAERRVNLGRQTLEFIVGGPDSAEAAETVFEREMAAAVRKL